MRLFLLFLYTSALTFFFAFLFPGHRFSYYAPFLIISCYRISLPGSLWWALLSGLIMDLLSSDTRFGAYSLTYSLTLLYLYRYKFHFFKDHLTTIPLMTYLFVCFSNLLKAILFYGSGKELFVSRSWFLDEFLWIPLANAIFAFCFFTLPTRIFLNKRGPIRKNLFRRRRVG